MKVFLFLTIAFAIAAVVLSDKDDHDKKNGDRSHHEKKHHGERSHHDSKKNKNDGNREDSYFTESVGADDRYVVETPWCNMRQMRVCGGYKCPILTCANYDNEVENWGKCLYDTDNNFTNSLRCKRITIDRSTKCICSFGLVLDEETGTCVKISECSKVRTNPVPTTVRNWFRSTSPSTESYPDFF